MIFVAMLNTLTKAAATTVFFIYILQCFSPLRLVGDGIDYLLQASSAADGMGFYVHGQRSMRPPGYPLLIVGLIKAGIGKPWAIVALNCLFLGIGCVAAYMLVRKTSGITPRKASLACLLTLLSFVVVRQAAQPLSDICFFGSSMVCLLLIARAETDESNRWWLMIVAAALLVFSIELRTIGVALLPAFAWVLFGGTSTLAKVPSWSRQHKISFAGVVLILLTLLSGIGIALKHSRYFQFNQPILNHRGVAGTIWLNVVDHSQEWGEMSLNVPVSRLPRSLAVPVRCLGIVVLFVCCLGLWRHRKRPTAAFWYVLCFGAIVLGYPWFDTRLWLPLFPLIVSYVCIGLARVTNERLFLPVSALWCSMFILCGAAALAYSTKLTFANPIRFADVYGDGNLRPAYKLVFQAATSDGLQPDNDAVYLLRRYR